MSHETRNALRAITMSPDTMDALDEIAVMLTSVPDDAALDLDVYDARDAGMCEIVSLDDDRHAPIGWDLIEG